MDHWRVGLPDVDLLGARGLLELDVRADNTYSLRFGTQENRHDRELTLAAAAIVGMGRHLRHAAPLDPGRWQGAPFSYAPRQSLVECPPLRHLARPLDLADSARRSDLRDPLRLRRPS